MNGGPFFDFLIYNAKSVFLTVNASLRWLNNVGSVNFSPGFLASYLSARFGTFLQVSRPLLPIS
jgi:hypothetical protein